MSDSTAIRRFLEKRYGYDLDGSYDAQRRAVAWTVEKFVEEHLYWMLVYTRWQIDANFEKGPAHFFDRLPEAVRDGARQKQREAVLANLRGHGMGRHGYDEVGQLAEVGFVSLSELLGNKQFLLGEEPCGADASVFGQIASILTPLFDGPVHEAAKRHDNLIAYSDRMMARYYPEHVANECTPLSRPGLSG